MASLLLVDGDKNFGRALAVALRLDGVEVATAATVDEALGLLSPGAFDACVVDCLLPGADELFSRLARETGIRVFATAAHLEILGGAVRRHPLVAPIPKPFGVADLRARLAFAPAQAG